MRAASQLSRLLLHAVQTAAAPWDTAPPALALLPLAPGVLQAAELPVLGQSNVAVVALPCCLMVKRHPVMAASTQGGEG